MIETQIFYTQTAEKYQKTVESTAKKANTVAMLRLGAMLLLLGSTYYFFRNEDWLTLVAVGVVLAIAFFILVVQHTRLKEKLQFFEQLVKVNEEELAYLNGDLTPFDDGRNFIDAEHPYSFDLDIFGEKSIFQTLNRTTTALGAQKLADFLANPKIENITEQQNAVKELSENADWRQNFRASGLLFSSENKSLDRFNYWLEKPSELSGKTFLRTMSFVLPALTCLIFVLNLVSNLPYIFDIFKVSGILNLLIVGSFFRKIKEESELLTAITASFKHYSKLLQTIENQRFNTKILRGLKERVQTKNESASTAISQLSRLLNQLDSAANPIGALLVNGLFQYHLHALFALDKWKQTHGKKVNVWFDAIAEFEALSSIGNFAFNHPEFTFPTENTEGVLLMKNVGHPLIPKDKRIGNDVHFGQQTFVILTGSNMSGKSTFLRTLGVNLVLAKIGAPVCADQFSFVPYPIFISMRVSDSLQNSESFFFAELKRLKRIVTQLESGEKTFVILDEILRGTNSNDKRAGTIGLIQNLLAHKAVGIIATHDLVVGEMTPQYPNALENKCFEVELAAEGLNFDYKLREGVAQQMSAAYLMQKMGIVK